MLVRTLTLTLALTAALSAQIFGGGNANKLRGNNIVSPLSCSDGNVLSWDAGNSYWECGTPAAAGSSITIGNYTTAACSTAGSTIFTSDSPFVEVCNGSTYNTYGPLTKSMVPLIADYTAVNADNATATDTNGGIFVNDTNEANDEIHYWYKTTPAAPYTITVRLSQPNITRTGGFPSSGIGVSEAGGAIKLFARTFDGAVARYGLSYWTGTTVGTFVRNDKDLAAIQSDAVCLRIADNNTNRIYSISSDCINFSEFFSELRTADFTATRAHFFLRTSGTAADMNSTTIQSWVEN